MEEGLLIPQCGLARVSSAGSTPSLQCAFLLLCLFSPLFSYSGDGKMQGVRLKMHSRCVKAVQQQWFIDTHGDMTDLLTLFGAVGGSAALHDGLPNGHSICPSFFSSPVSGVSAGI